MASAPGPFIMSVSPTRTTAGRSQSSAASEFEGKSKCDSTLALGCEEVDGALVRSAKIDAKCWGSGAREGRGEGELGSRVQLVEPPWCNTLADVDKRIDELSPTCSRFPRDPLWDHHPDWICLLPRWGERSASPKKTMPYSIAALGAIWARHQMRPHTLKSPRRVHCRGIACPNGTRAGSPQDEQGALSELLIAGEWPWRLHDHRLVIISPAATAAATATGV